MCVFIYFRLLINKMVLWRYCVLILYFSLCVFTIYICSTCLEMNLFNIFCFCLCSLWFWTPPERLLIQAENYPNSKYSTARYTLYNIIQRESTYIGHTVHFTKCTEHLKMLFLQFFLHWECSFVHVYYVFTKNFQHCSLTTSI